MDPNSIQESEDYFRGQFDPNSPFYHKGDQTLVPVGGARVPESMPTMFQQNAPTIPQLPVQAYGPEYLQCQSLRSLYLNTKKVLGKFNMEVEAAFRARQKQPDSVPTPQSFPSYGELQTSLPLFQPQFQHDLANVLKQSLIPFKTKQQLTDFNFAAKRFSAAVFSEAAKLLQKMKDIKKAAVGAATEAPTQ